MKLELNDSLLVCILIIFYGDCYYVIEILGEPDVAFGEKKLAELKGILLGDCRGAWGVA